PTPSPGKHSSNERSIAGEKPTSQYQSAQTSHNPVSGQRSALAAKEGSRRKTALRRIKNSGVICCANPGTKMEILVRKGISHEAQKQAHDCDSHGSARRPRSRSRLPAGQVLADIAERNRVLRLPGIRGLGGAL